MAYRRLINLLPRGSDCILQLQKPLHVITQTVHEPAIHHVGRSKRILHTGAPLMLKLLSVEELFTRKSLQQHLKKIEVEYGECLQAVSGNVTEDQCNEDEMRTKRIKVSQLAPLIQNIRELDKKLTEVAETEMLLRGETKNISE